MTRHVCLDSSVLVKILVWEEGSNAAADLMGKSVDEGLTILLPAFAWAEVGSMLRRKVRVKEITPEEAEKAWDAFRRLGVTVFLDNEQVRDTAWHISVDENLTTLYDAAYLAVAEVVSKDGDEACEFWTADERLVNSLSGKKNYVKLVNYPALKDGAWI